MPTPLIKLLGQRELLAVITQPSGPYRILVGGSAPAMANAVVTPDGSAPRLVALTQLEFDALDPPDASTTYIIVSDA